MVRTLLALSVAPLLLATACQATTGQLQALSAGSIGCPQDEVSISDPQKIGWATTSWQAACRGHAFICGVSGAREIACSPLLAPVAGAPPPAPGAPPPPPEDPATACAEAGAYDRRAAAATSPAKEQLQTIADHKHRDCAAGQTEAAATQSAPVVPPKP